MSKPASKLSKQEAFPLESCLVANDTNGIEAIGASTTIVRVSNSTVTDNTNGLKVTGAAKLLSRTNNTVEGNAPNLSGTGTYTAQ